MTATKTSLETAPATRTQWLITLYAGGGEFCDGYILSIIGVALPLLTAAFSLTPVTAGLLGAASLVGMEHSRLRARDRPAPRIRGVLGVANRRTVELRRPERAHPRGQASDNASAVIRSRRAQAGCTPSTRSMSGFISCSCDPQ